MSKLFTKGLLIGLIVSWQAWNACATGDYNLPPKWLENGGDALINSPQFFWKEQMVLMAQAFKPVEKRVEGRLLPANPAAPGDSPQQERETFAAQTARVDLEEFHEAIATGAIKPADPTAAEAAHSRQRQMINPGPLLAGLDLPGDPPAPEEFRSEFADYHRGALAWGGRKFDLANAAWQELLARPKSERHYRSVWAAYMLGRCAIEDKRYAEAVKWFQQSRALAGEGFADRLGLAAESYGWEAYAELVQDHWEQSAKLYLTQLATGDESALNSLNSFILDWNFPYRSKSIDAMNLGMTLVKVAKVPLLRRIETAHVLATESIEPWTEGYSSPDKSRSTSWLQAIQDANITDVEDADSLGWVAYGLGDYKAAQEWLEKCKSPTGLSFWLRTKFFLREGKFDEALATMKRAVTLLDESVKPPFPHRSYYYYHMLDSRTTMSHAAHADLAALYLGHGEFVLALTHFEHTLLTDDMAYVAERLLSTDELVQHVEKTFPWGSVEQDKAAKFEENSDFDGPEPPPGFAMRHLLAKRLVREGRFEEARCYMPPSCRSILDEYTKKLKSAANTALPKMERAHSYFDAASLLMKEGWSIMATTGEPDSLDRDSNSMTLERQTGKLMARGTNNQFVKSTTDLPQKIHVPVTQEEKRRLAQHKIIPFKTNHFRYVALDLVWKSAALLQDNTDELADILNTAGTWIRGDLHGDDIAADKFFQAIERRAPKTKVGQAASAKHWFVDDHGPWSVGAEDGKVQP